MSQANAAPAGNRRMTVSQPMAGSLNGAFSLNQDAIYVCQLLAINPDDLVVR